MTQPTGPRQDASPGRPEPARTPPPTTPARQRWRLVVAVPAPAGHGAIEPAAGWSWPALLASSGLPLAGEAAGRGRVSPAASLPPGVAGEREVVDFYLSRRLSVAEVRRAVADALPPGASLVDLRDVWVGAPAAPAVVVAADYRVLVAGPARWLLEGAVLALLGTASLPRERRREKKTSAYDLRPLILGLEVRTSDGSGATLAMRLRHAPDVVGRPEEVVAALGEPPASLGEAPTIRSIVRERIVMADDADAPPAR